MNQVAEPTVASTPLGAQRRPHTVLAVFCVVGCFWWLVIHQLGAQWSVYEQYHYGWAVPLLCGYLAWLKLRPSETNARQSTESSEASGPATTERQGAFRYVVIALALCALVYAPTRVLHEANPIWRFTSFLLASEAVVAMLCFVFLIGGHAAFRKFLFPVCFFLVAVPWPSGLESNIIQSLTRWNVAATVEFLSLFGVPAIQHGNVIEIGTGMVGIDEACSGIRSLQATFMISLFLGEFYSLNIRRRTLCVCAGIAFSFIFNVARTSFLTWVGATKGTSQIGHWHDPAGVTILVACFLSLWLLARLLAANGNSADESAGASAAFGTFQPHFAVIAAATLGVWLAMVEFGTEAWFRSHEARPQANREWALNSVTATPSCAQAGIPSEIMGQFRADDGAHRLWRDPDGNSWQLYYFHWLPGDSLERRVAVQLAKTHGPEKCLPAIGMTMKSDLGIFNAHVGDATLAFRQYLFLSDGQPLHVFYGLYEDSAGSAVLANRRKDFLSRINAALAGSRNYGQQLLEIAIAGPDQPRDAATALERSLPEMIALEK